MAPLLVLIVTFTLLSAVNKFLLNGKLSISQTGRYALAAMLLLTGTAHFTSSGSDMMVEMMPDVIPFKLKFVYFTGACELAAVLGLILNKTSRLAAILLIVFFIAVLPANIAGSLKQVNYSGMDYGAAYLLFRIPLQIFFIWWAWYFGLRRNHVTV